MDLRGKKVLITGGASGIGLCTAREFAQRRAVPILVDINEVTLERELNELRSDGYEAYGFTVDITDIEKLRDLAQTLEEQGLSPDLLVNCAGLTLIAHVSATTHKDWMSILDEVSEHLLVPLVVRTGIPHNVFRRLRGLL